MNINAITSQQAKMAYESFYIPAMRYSLSITSINQMDFDINDSYIMDSPYLATLTRKQQILINCCRLFLQVECLSDISSADGTRIREEWMECNTVKPSRSLKKWPLQGNPGDEAWKIWRNFLTRAFLRNDKSLLTPLGGWKGEIKCGYIVHTYNPNKTFYGSIVPKIVGQHTQ
jgi:hypothetical protein